MHKFARTQYLFKECPKLLAKMVHDNTMEADISDSLEINACPESLRKYYTELWGEKGPCKMTSTKDTQTVQQDPLSILPPFSNSEVRGRISRTRTRVAAGPDGIRKGDLQRKGLVREITAFFNLALIALKQPSEWDVNTTTLILKEGKNPKDPASYRPITISSILSRVYWGLIDGRLKDTIDISKRQKGFTVEQGCFNNVNILNEAIRIAKLRKGMTIVQVDISKAFDSLPQEALRAKGVPDEARQMIKKLLHQRQY